MAVWNPCFRTVPAVPCGSIARPPGAARLGHRRCLMKRPPIPYVLMVGENAGSALVEGALSAGAEVRRCPGPPDVGCPAAADKRCPLRKGAKATILYLDGRDREFPTLPCLAADAGATVVVLEGSRLPLSVSDGYALVGSDRGTLGVLEAMAAIAEPPIAG